MGSLLALIAVVLVIGVVMAQMPSLSHFLDEGSSKFETWADHSIARIFGLPLLSAFLVAVTAELSGHLASVAQFFFSGLVLGILYAVAHAVGGRSRMRLGIQMLFMTCFFGALIVLAML